MVIRIDTFESVAGSSYIGSVLTTRACLTNLFGEPDHVGGEGDKVTIEWWVRFEDGTVATIYDWKRYEDGTPDFDELYAYHIGGFNEQALKQVKGKVNA